MESTTITIVIIALSGVFVCVVIGVLIIYCKKKDNNSRLPKGNTEMVIVHGSGVGTGMMRKPNKKPKAIAVHGHTSSEIPEEALNIGSSTSSTSSSPFRIRIDSPKERSNNKRYRFSSPKFARKSKIPKKVPPKPTKRAKPALPKGERNRQYTLDEEEKKNHENTTNQNTGQDTPVAMATPVLNAKEGQLDQVLNVCMYVCLV